MLNGFSLDIHEGEFFFLLGPSGCGKTTLLKIVSGLLEPDSGKILLSGTDITHIPPHRRDVNTVFQNYALFPHLTIFENVAFGLKMKGKEKSFIREKVSSMLKMVELSGFESRKPDSLSGGQQQRVALARALVNEPAILLLDEPLGALDVKLRRSMRTELKNLQRKLGTTFICVTHDQEEAMSMADRIAVINHGEIHQIGTPEEVYHHPADHFVAGFMGEMNFIPVETAADVGGFVEVGCGIGLTIKAAKCGMGSMDVNEAGVRPEHIALKTIDADIADGMNRLRGKVVESIFTGNLRYYVFEGGGLRLRSMNGGDGAHILERGTECTAEWKPEHTLIFQK